jgi:hypothetical protein
MQRAIAEVFFLGFSCLLFSSTDGLAQGSPIGFAEQWALATDRGKVLGQLIPGTRDFYYYHCRHKQDTGDFAAVEPLMRVWIQRHGRTARVIQIENRQALLTFEDNPSETLKFIQQRLGLNFDHQRQISEAKRNVPSRLDPTLVSSTAFARRALLKRPRSTSGFRESAFDSLLVSELNEELLMSLLGRLKRPDVVNLPALVIRNLQNKKSRGFGSLAIHKLLLLDQLNQCATLMPELLNNQHFVRAYLQRLIPSEDRLWSGDMKSGEAYLDRLHTFVQRLSPAHNSLKAHVLYHRLKFDMAAGKPNKARFMAYLRLPRPGSYVNPQYLRDRGNGGQMVDMKRVYPTGFKGIGNDNALVRQYLMHFFVTEDSYQPYSQTVQDDYLRRLFAETKILNGLGDMERWYSLLNDPVYYENLKDRVEIEFLPTLKRYYGSGDQVSMALDVKNVTTLLVKVFEINAFNYYRQKNRNVDASINLDGLIANKEMAKTYEANPMRRIRRTFEFPSLSGPGVYVVEFIGNGISSRAVIQKGRLQYTQRLGAAGHVLMVRDEAGDLLKDATAWFGGRNYVGDEDGEIVIPYSTKPGSRPLILSHGDFSTLENFAHSAEKYDLSSGVFLDRETLLARSKAEILLRPSLRLNGNPISFELLEDPVLTIVSKDSAGIASSLEVRDLKLSRNRELVHQILVPSNLATISVRLSGRVRSISKGEKVTLATSATTFKINTIDASKLTACPLLGRSSKGYVVDVLGKNGEPRAQRTVRLTFSHRDYTEVFTVTLKTNDRGRIDLGSLPGIATLQASGFPSGVGSWSLQSSGRTYPGEIHALVGDIVQVPYMGDASVVSRSLASLLETRGGVFVRDAFGHVALGDGFLELRNLEAGDYSLFLKEAGRQIQVRVTAGNKRQGWAIGRDRVLEVSNKGSLHISKVTTEQDQLRVQLANAGAGSRVHVFATRYMSAYDVFAGLRSAWSSDKSYADVVHPESSYQSGRVIGDEYRYILDRRFARKYPGNMLHRPGIILNPWALDDSLITAIGLGGGSGGKWGGRAGGRKSARERRSGGASGRRAVQSPGSFVNLEFLSDSARVLTNLTANKDGVVEIPWKSLGDGQMLHVVAVDGEETVYRSIVRDESPLVARSRQLPKALNSKQHFSERRKIEFVKVGGSAVLDDASNVQAQTYDSLQSIFQLFTAMSGNADLREFAFILEWPTLDVMQKQKYYEDYACHELHFFLHQKDPEFFKTVVRPFLANKARKTFLDDWLLGSDLSPYLDPWKFARLNIAERALLARRVRNQSDSINRHIGELFDLKPSDPTRSEFLFRGALDSLALSQGLWFKGKLAESEKRLGLNTPRTAGRRANRTITGAEQFYTGAKAAPVDEQVEEVEVQGSEPGPASPGALAASKKSVSKDKAAAILRKDMDRRGLVSELYRAPESTKPYVEHNYWHRRNTEHLAGLIEVNGFWRDFASAPRDQPFLSSRVAEATSNFAEMMLALSVLDLPFESAKHETVTEGARITLKAATPLLLVRKELVETKAGAEDSKNPVLVSQNYFRLDEPYRFEGKQRYDAYITDEFLIDVAYGCRVVVTNPTSAPRNLELLLQIPEGGIPVQGGFYTKGMNVVLQAYGTSSIEYAFYFPVAGSMPHYPVHVSSNGKLVAFAGAGSLPVVKEATKVDTSSWLHISQNGDNKAMLAYLDSANVQRTDLSKIAWRMRDATVFGETIKRLRSRHAYSDILWSYGIRHADVSVVREYLQHQNGFLTRCGRALDSTLIRIDPVERNLYQHVEYEPLFNARAHRFGKQRRILNDHFASQYQSLLLTLGDRKSLSDEDWMSVTYYLLLQDRVEEALASFARVRATELPMRVQYDYMEAYLDFFTEGHTAARRIATRYEAYPVDRWRKLFANVKSQLDEVSGAAVTQVDPDSRTQQQTGLAANAPSLELKVEAKKVALNYRNVDRCQVRYYQMDVEFLFSTHPFVQQGAGSFAYIKPNHSESRELPAGKSALAFDLPEALQNSNVLVEVRAGGVIRRQAYYANSLAVRWIETYGQLKVAHKQTGKPLGTVYVKVFARMPNGTVKFYKDGYTDIRGRFDYASLSAEGSRGAKQYSILVMSEDHGAVIREVAPPAQ